MGSRTFSDSSLPTTPHSFQHSHSFQQHSTTMKITASLITLAALALGVAANNGGSAPAKDNIDTTILNYALTLEYLEADFYKGILARFDKHAFKAEGFNFATYQRVRELARQEAVHVTTLQTVLGADATSPCQYSFPYNTVSEA